MLTTLNILSLDQGKGIAFRAPGDRDPAPAEEDLTVRTDRTVDLAGAGAGVGRGRTWAVCAAVAAALVLPFTTTRRRASP